MSRTAAMGEQGYFQFPLCLLALGEDHQERLQHIVSYCLYEQAKRRNPKFPRSARNGSLEEAANFLGVNIRSPDSTTSRWREADGFVRNWEQRYGKDARVRIGTKLLWGAYDNSGVSYREFFHPLRDQFDNWQTPICTKANHRAAHSSASGGF
jgi:hypothetical protein